VTTPMVSVGMPVYNGEKYLRQALNSLLAQDYEDFELIISDNGSTDRTREICLEYAGSDQRIRYYRAEANQGAAWNYNQVFALAQGAYFKWAAHDDECLPRFLSRCVETLEQASASVVLVYPKSELIDAEGKVIGLDQDCLETRRPRPHQRFADLLRNVSKASTVFGLIRAEALRKTRLIDRFIASDYVLLGELALLGELWEIPDVLFRRRFHPEISAKPTRYWFQLFVTSSEAKRSWSELVSWFDPSKKKYGSIWSPNMRLGWEYAKSVYRLPVSRWNKPLCYMMIPLFWYMRHFRNVAGMYKRRLKKILGLPVDDGSKLPV
jgi:glycosyltransferase involved in cell wall biosynthesis